MDLILNLSQTGTAQNPPFCYESLNGSCHRIVYPLQIRLSLYIFFGAMVILTVFGNLLVIITIFHFKQLHTSTNYLILSLAIADFLMGVFVMPPSMLRSVETCWYLGNFFCKIHSSVDVMLCTASILNLSFISIDRYYAVCHPLQYRSRITPLATGIMIAVCWSVSAVIGLGMIFLELNILGIEEFYYNNIVCEGGCILFQTSASSTVSSVLSFYIPGIIMLGIYLKIFLVAQRQAQAIQNTTNQSKTSNKQPSLSKTEKKATKTLAIIMGVFLSFWTPFFICNVIDPMIGYLIPPVLFDMLVWVGYLNSTCNPIVYAFFYSWFRNAFRVILLGKVFQPDSSRMKLFSE
ncbi:trace amine-associated receptor 1-like [Chanos chanos]|uniref:Trace amine-associated receptor 1 n=1 Tax=Chanos chanos TaxID=29144 RepID=A0A6J2W1R2_CHACN|nr:trace amine-associated receptor 1-like [Chanos chanos]